MCFLILLLLRCVSCAMSHQKNNEEYWTIRTEAKSFYSTIGNVECSALNNESISFNSIGFNHLIRKEGSLRSKKEQVRRFRLLKYASATLKSDSTLASHWQGKGAEFWSFKKIFKDRQVIVIVRRIYGGCLHFFSIMDVIFPSKNPPKEML